MNNFWTQLKKPFFALAPMDAVTDVVFRQIVNEVASADVYFTEFTNVEGLTSKGKDSLMPRLLFKEEERPIVAQIWGKNPENYFRVAQMLEEIGFDGIDINMGCPDRAIIKNGSCGALINNPGLAKEIIDATKKGAPSLPVSVKTRIGFNKIVTEEWIGFLLDQNSAALTVHARTVREMSKVPAHWEEIKKVVEIRNMKKVDTLIIGNGDVEDRDDGLKKVKEYGVDGIMIGRGIFNNIHAFSKEPHQKKDPQEMLNILLKHAQLYIDTWGESKSFIVLRKFFKIYASGFPDASDLRVQLMSTQNIEEVKQILHNFNSRKT